MKTVIVPDWLDVLAGAEKVIAVLTDIYPNADIKALVDFLEDANRMHVLKGKKVETSFIQKLPFSKKYFRNYLPFFPYAIEMLDLNEYEVIVSNSHSVAKGVMKRSDQLHISYCHTPMRYGWDMFHQYSHGNIYKKMFLTYFLNHLRIWDVVSSNRVDYFIANSKYIANRIESTYRRKADVIYPPVDVNKFSPEGKKEEYYLTASRLVPYKKVDIIVEAFRKMPDRRLIVIGDGPEMQLIKQKASKNIEIMGFQSEQILIQHMQKAKAFVYAAEEDFGIVPVEAQACGTPVIAFAKGGSTETVKNAITGLFFYEQSSDSIKDAIEKFETMESKFDVSAIRNHSEQFSVERFKQQFNDYVQHKKEDFFG